ncbi:ABC transporter ATP-binding protein [Natronoglycomyces albus]|uniref:ABC-type quaternary amine transporter n=1 Tax=Natronoglycomyces albus TaxID=2811108 RepID=A0A895XDL0_9ACTN|nr:ABC transporter ATP-binding protein [Natronoglycomyces albus]QSB03891.1 ABC transporter ATP-binding protein [Natronoglycomyces albus]
MGELQLRKVSKRFGPTRALHEIDLDIPSGHMTAVLGPSGCGKTTLLRCVAGFESLDAGEIWVAGGRIDNLRPERRNIAVVPQEGALFPHLTVARNIAYGLRRFARKSDRVSEVLELVGLPGYEKRMPHELSGGQQQRVALARAMAPHPALILLDEPFSALDASLRADLRAQVRQALAADEATAVLVTHDQEEALSVADKVAVMCEGQIQQVDIPTQLYSRPTNEWVARFVGEAVMVPAQVRSGRAETSLGNLPVDVADGTARIMVRPEQIQLDHTAVSGPTATIAHIEYFGHDTLVDLQLSDGMEVTARILGAAPQVGQEVSVSVSGDVVAYQADKPLITEKAA